MVEVNVTINGIILYCDESCSDLQIGNGYSIKKVSFDEVPFKKKITAGDGNLAINYIGSRIFTNDGIYFMCLQKEDIYQIPEPDIIQGVTLTGRDLMCEEQIEQYKEKEMEFINRMFSLLHLYKAGNIGPKEIFLEHRYTVMGLFNNNQKQTSDNVSRNIVDNRVLILSPDEVINCNSFLQDYSGREFDLLKNCINEFTWGLEQIDIPTGFEQYTTTLEMLLLATNQQGKKEVLSKRVAVLLENDAIKIKSLYDKIKDFYRYRSESLHEGDGRNITKTELIELEEVVRSILVKYLEFCKIAIQRKMQITWDEVKAENINALKIAVGNAITAGVLPA